MIIVISNPAKAIYALIEFARDEKSVAYFMADFSLRRKK
jgi:hypothetical protein